MKIDPARDFDVRECPSCATHVPANNNRCPLCGYLFPQPPPLRRELRLWGTLIMLGLLLLLLFGWW